MRRRTEALAALATSLSTALACGAPADPTRGSDGSPIQIVLISIDTLRADYLGTYDPSRDTSPHLDAFGAENVVFADAWAQAPSTLTSHKSIFTSLYPSIHKTRGETVPRERLESPLERLQRLGWTTGAIVSGGRLSAGFRFDAGFDSYLEIDPRERRAGADQIDYLEQHSRDWLRAHRDEPFLLFLHTYQVHCPYFPPEPYRSRYAGWYQGDLDPEKRCGGWFNRADLDEEDLRFVRDLYAGEVAYTDAWFGRLVAELRSLGLYDRAYIAIFSDHGEALGERGYVGHNRLHDEQLRVPLLLKLPGLGPARVEEPVETIDLMPTLFAAIGVDPPYAFQGRDLRPLIRGEGGARGHQIAEREGRAAIREAGRLAVFDFRRGGKARVYDLAQDPEATRDVAPRHAETLARLRSHYDSMLRDGRDVADAFVLEDAPRPQLSDETRQQLEALGYLDDGGGD